MGGVEWFVLPDFLFDKGGAISILLVWRAVLVDARFLCTVFETGLLMDSTVNAVPPARSNLHPLFADVGQAVQTRHL